MNLSLMSFQNKKTNMIYLKNSVIKQNLNTFSYFSDLNKGKNV